MRSKILQCKNGVFITRLADLGIGAGHVSHDHHFSPVGKIFEVTDIARLKCVNFNFIIIQRMSAQINADHLKFFFSFSMVFHSGKSGTFGSAISKSALSPNKVLADVITLSVKLFPYLIAISIIGRFIFCNGKILRTVTVRSHQMLLYKLPVLPVFLFTLRKFLCGSDQNTLKGPLAFRLLISSTTAASPLLYRA